MKIKVTLSVEDAEILRQMYEAGELDDICERQDPCRPKALAEGDLADHKIIKVEPFDEIPDEMKKRVKIRILQNVSKWPPSRIPEIEPSSEEYFEQLLQIYVYDLNYSDSEVLDDRLVRRIYEKALEKLEQQLSHEAFWFFQRCFLDRQSLKAAAAELGIGLYKAYRMKKQARDFFLRQLRIMLN